MSVNFGSNNETRWYVLPEFTLPAGNWTWLASASDSSGDWYVIFRRSVSGVITSGSVKSNSSVITNPPAVTDGPLSGATELWKGSLSWVAMLDIGLSNSQLFNLANLSESLLPTYQHNLVDLWDFSEPLASIPGFVSGQPAVRYGNGYSSTNVDPIPYQQSAVLPVPVSFSGTVPTLQGFSGTSFNAPIFAYFSGTETPFTYALISGTLPSGLSLNASTGVISGTVSAVTSVSGLVVRATDNQGNTAQTNSFGINITQIQVAEDENLKIIKNNILSAYSDLTHVTGSTAAGYPLTNLLSDIKSKTWRSTNNGAQKIRIVWSQTQRASGIALAFTNLTSINTVRIQTFSNPSSGSASHDSSNIQVGYNYESPEGFNTNNNRSFGFGGGTHFSYFFPEQANIRRIEIDLAGIATPDGFFEISRLIIGDVFTAVVNPTYGLQIDNIDSSETIRTDAGDSIVNRSYQYRELSFDLAWMERNDKSQMASLFRKCGRHTPVFINVLPGEFGEMRQWGQIYGRFDSGGISYSDYENFSSIVNVVEV